MNLSKIWTMLKSLPTWARIVLILSAAFAAFALSSCTRRVYRINTSAEKFEFNYSDSLYSKHFLQW